MAEVQLFAPEYYNMVNDIERHAEQPDKLALLWEDEAGNTKQYTYGQLSKLSNRLANGLVELGIHKGDKIMIILPRLEHAYISYMAALKIGAIILPGSEMLMPKDILYRATHSQVKAIICFRDATDNVDAVRQDFHSLKTFIVVGGQKEGWMPFNSVVDGKDEWFEIENTRGDDIAFLNYTSGTTGNPKGVIHTHSWAFAHQAVAAKMWLDVHDGDIVWATAGPGWAKWNWSPFISTLGSGATGLSYFGKFDAKKYLSLLEKYKVNVLCCTPTEYRIMAKEDGLENYNLEHLHSTVSAGEPLNREVIDTFKKYFNLTVRDGYGQTENSLIIGTLKGMEVKPGSMGRPAPGNRIAIIDEDGNPVKQGEVGDIAVHRSVPALFKGYLNDPERTASAFRGDWYLTGDQAREDEDGYYFFEGRSDDIIISSGYTIGPFEVEDALVKHPAVKECAVVASPDPIRGSIVKAFVILRDASASSDELVKELQAHVKNITAPYKYPREIEFVADLPKTTSGKIRRVELRQLEKDRKVN
ncbi:acyl--CoA ligase [Aneurinibacillus sp. Ricciae_BoGa-3]|uniref:acyl-CoA synthetase MbcS n=1 Tax=Aneurinibacillus sp. Ricciae_BoGa-3 TaxID=3022697 RepID=UPI00234096E5|nr:acyl--CoA ligase [Aneurinibacillus sp. Ricciae_BoGa-3]WCK55832.1 acyl--CoA ligase [Aneurinibacillus sp. Ricciae_BoGa-3]